MMKCAETGVGEANSGDFRGDGVKRNVHLWWGDMVLAPGFGRIPREQINIDYRWKGLNIAH